MISILKTLTKPVAAALASAQSTVSALWTFPSVLGSAMLIAWGAEAAQFLISQGLALAILAWLQTLPEFAVEAVIASEAGKAVHQFGAGTPEANKATALMTANFTGSLRLLVGLGWPMIYGTAAFFYRRREKKPLGEIRLEREHSVEVVFLLVSIGYFVIVWARGTLTWIDSLILTFIYIVYLFFLNKIPPQQEEKMEDMDRIPKYILSRRPATRNSLIISLFLGGGLILYFAAHPFLESLKAIALGMGISTFVFIQWVAPFLSEFPEKVSAFNWARKVHSAPMALMNMVSSNINQWTMLVAMLPLAYAFSLGSFGTIYFDHHQRVEILMTIGQSFLGALLLANMRFGWWESLLLFLLWATQFFLSAFEVEGVENFATIGKEVITGLYFAWSSIILLMAFRKRSFEAITEFPRLIREHW